MNNARRMLGGALLAAATLAAAGCAGPGPAWFGASAGSTWDGRFGDAVRGMRAQQTLDPEAPTKNAGKGTKQDGKAGRATHDAYVGTFSAPSGGDVTGPAAAPR